MHKLKWSLIATKSKMPNNKATNYIAKKQNKFQLVRKKRENIQLILTRTLT